LQRIWEFNGTQYMQLAPNSTTPNALPNLNPNPDNLDNLDSSDNCEHGYWPPVVQFDQLREPLIDDTPENAHP